MKRKFLLVLVVGQLVAVATALALQPAAKDNLEGTWKLASVEINGQPLSMEKLQDARLAVQGPKYSLALGDVHLEMTHVLIADKEPKQMDVTIAEGAEKGQFFRAIYKLEGDTFTVCRNITAGAERPTKFATQADTGLMLVVWTRSK